MPKKKQPISPLSSSNFPRPKLMFSDTVNVIIPKNFDNTLLDLKSPVHMYDDENKPFCLNRQSPIQRLLKKTTGHDLHATIMLHCEGYAKSLSPTSLLLWNKYFKEKIDSFNCNKEKYTSRDIAEYKKNICNYFEWLMMVTYLGDSEKVMALRKDLKEVSSLAGIEATLSDIRLSKAVYKKDFNPNDRLDWFSLSLLNCLLNVIMKSNLVRRQDKTSCLHIVKKVFSEVLKDQDVKKSNFSISSTELNALASLVRKLPNSLAKATKGFLRGKRSINNRRELELFLAMMQDLGVKINEAENLIEIGNYLQDLNNYMDAPTNEDIINEFDHNSKVRRISA